MGPRLGSRGKRATRPLVPIVRAASMGPRLGSRGKGERTRSELRPVTCFNGAATWKSRKATNWNPHGPRPSKLQWGRDLEVAERTPNSVAASLTVNASMGPRLGSRGKVHVSLAVATIKIASMGPRLGSRGKGPVYLRPLVSEVASMGPRLGSRGKLVEVQGCVGYSSLQWGRDLEVAESEGYKFQVGPIATLQWGRDLEVAESHRQELHPRLLAQASMGPRLGSRGKIAMAGRCLSAS